MALELFAGIPVSDYAVALPWYERLFGAPPAFHPNDVEAVWQLDERAWIYIVHLPERAGHAVHTLFVTDLDTRLAALADRGLAPSREETYDNGVRKITFTDPDGNELSFGGAPD